MPHKYFCTLYDIENRVPELYSRENHKFTEPIGRILEEILTQSNIFYLSLKQFCGTELNVAPYFTIPICRNTNQDSDASLASPTIITDTTAVESDTFMITIIDSTTFSILSVVTGKKQTASKNSDFTDASGLYKIDSTNWSGSFAIDDKIIFAYENYEPLIREIVSYMVGESLLRGRWASESAGSVSPLVTGYSDKIKEKMDGILVTGVLRLTGMRRTYGQPPSSDESWLGYDIDTRGLMED